jgi:hypothetical protein
MLGDKFVNEGYSWFSLKILFTLLIWGDGYHYFFEAW